MPETTEQLKQLLLAAKALSDQLPNDTLGLQHYYAREQLLTLREEIDNAEQVLFRTQQGTPS